MTGQLAMPGLEPVAYGGEHDFYETPHWAVELVLPKLPLHRHRWHVLEPAAGRGAILDVVVPAVGPSCVAAVEVDAVRFQELQARHGGVVGCVQADFLSMDLAASFPGLGGPRLLPMNPPYTKPRETIGLEFVERAIEVAGPDGVVAALLPLDFATGDARTKRVHRKHRSSLYPLRRRPDFGGDFGGGKRPFAWFVWDLGEPKSDWEVLG